MAIKSFFAYTSFSSLPFFTFLEDPWVQRRGALGASSGVGSSGCVGQGTSSQNDWEGNFLVFFSSKSNLISINL